MVEFTRFGRLCPHLERFAFASVVDFAQWERRMLLSSDVCTQEGITRHDERSPFPALTSLTMTLHHDDIELVAYLSNLTALRTLDISNSQLFEVARGEHPSNIVSPSTAMLWNELRGLTQLTNLELENVEWYPAVMDILTSSPIPKFLRRLVVEDDDKCELSRSDIMTQPCGFGNPRDYSPLSAVVHLESLQIQWQMCRHHTEPSILKLPYLPSLREFGCRNYENTQFHWMSSMGTQFPALTRVLLPDSCKVVGISPIADCPLVSHLEIRSAKLLGHFAFMSSVRRWFPGLRLLTFVADMASASKLHPALLDDIREECRRNGIQLDVQLSPPAIID